MLLRDFEQEVESIKEDASYEGISDPLFEMKCEILEMLHPGILEEIYIKNAIVIYGVYKEIMEELNNVESI